MVGTATGDSEGLDVIAIGIGERVDVGAKEPAVGKAVASPSSARVGPEVGRATIILVGDAEGNPLAVTGPTEGLSSESRSRSSSPSFSSLGWGVFSSFCSFRFLVVFGRSTKGLWTPRSRDLEKSLILLRLM